MKRLSVIIPNWNGEIFLPDCLNSLKKQTYHDFEVIVIDNGSVDSSSSLIKENFPDYTLINLNENVGFAKAVNIGVEKSQSEYIVLLNNDTKIDRNCLINLVKAADEHPESGMVAAKMLQFNHPTRIDSVGDYIDSVGHANNIGFGQMDGVKFSSGKYVFLVTGGGCLIKKQVFESVGFFDEDYFAYFEDVDFCLRAQFKGFKAWFEPTAVIYHIHKATSNRSKPLVEYLQFRNMTMTVIKDFPWTLVMQDLNWLKIILVNLNTVRFLASQGYLIQALRAQIYILLSLPKLLRKRYLVQSGITVSSRYIIENIQPKKITLFNLFKGGV